MINKIKLNLIKLLLPRKDIATIFTSVSITEEEYEKRYNNPDHVGYSDKEMKQSLDDLCRLKKYFGYMLGINDTANI